VGDRAVPVGDQVTHCLAATRRARRTRSASRLNAPVRGPRSWPAASRLLVRRVRRGGRGDHRVGPVPRVRPGEVSPEVLPTRHERHLVCNPERAQYIVDAGFPPVKCEGFFAKEALDPTYVAQEEARVTRAWRRLQEIPTLGSPSRSIPCQKKGRDTHRERANPCRTARSSPSACGWPINSFASSIRDASGTPRMTWSSRRN